MRKKLNIGKKLILGFSILSILQTLVISFVTINKSERILEENLEITSSQILQQVDEGFSKYLSSISVQLDMMSHNADIIDVQDIENREVSTGYVQELLYSVKNSSDDILNVYYGGEYGQVILEDDTRTQEEFDFKNRDWYVNAVNAGGDIIYTEPYVDTETNDLVITMAKMVKDNNDKALGVFGIDMKLTTVQEYISNIGLLKSGYALILKENGDMIINSEKNRLNIEQMGEQAFWKKAQVEEHGVYSCEINGNELIAVQQTNKDTKWKIVGIINRNEINDNMKAVGATIIMVGIISTVVVLAFASIISMRLVRPIIGLSRFMKEVAKGDFTNRTDVNTGDELEDLGNDINSMLENISVLISNVDDTLQNVIEASENIFNMSEITTTSISDVSSAIGEVSAGATNQAHGIQISNMSVDELSSKMAEVSQHTDKIKQLSNNAEKLSSNGLEMIDLLIEKSNKTKENSVLSALIVREMAQSISNINLMSNAIVEITEQTNLLSLNASIEAARAGEMGKGFAIVAEEIRLLSEQSRKSTDHILGIVDEITSKAKSAEDAMNESKKVLEEQETAVGRTEEVFKHILKSVTELSEGVNEVQQLNNEMSIEKDAVTNQMDNIAKISEETAAVSEEVSASAEEVNATMSELVEYAEKLKNMGNKLDEEMNKFKLK
ncbi:MAG: methyl-accepting chemotaxis protein [Clostridium sp.]|nr:methyl-accepting chemotaxis protein [Clostridium sp.]